MAKLPRDTAVAFTASITGPAPAGSSPSPHRRGRTVRHRRQHDTGTTATFLRRALDGLNRNGGDYANIPSTGTTGAATLAASGRSSARAGRPAETVLVKALEALQGARYTALTRPRPADETFLYGWLANRVG